MSASMFACDPSPGRGRTRTLLPPSPGAHQDAAATAPGRRLLPSAAARLPPAAAPARCRGARQGRPLRSLLQPPCRPRARAGDFLSGVPGGHRRRPAVQPQGNREKRI